LATYQTRVANPRYVGAVTRTASATTITRQPESQSIALGGSATFTVVAGCSPIPLNYQWRFNGTNLVEAVNSAIILTNVQVAQAGTYTVFVTNTSGSVLSSNAVLTVLDPCITDQPRSQPVAVGTPATFSVGAVGTAPLAYFWRKDGVVLADGGM